MINQEVFGIFLNHNEKKAIIISLKGKTLSKKEKLLLLKERPWGVILFTRNIKRKLCILSLEQSLKTIILLMYMNRSYTMTRE